VDILDAEKDRNQLLRIILQLEQIISEQAAQISELKSQLNKNSKNSSKPPSSDGYRKQAKILPPKNGKQGGQNGHRGNTLQQVETPDKIIECKPDICECGHHFTSTDIDITSPEIRQLITFLRPQSFVTEHQIFKARCPVCGKVHKGRSPLKAPIQYSDEVKTHVTILNTQYKMPLNKIKQYMTDLYGLPINEATIIASNTTLYKRLAKTMEIIKEQILSSDVVHADETGIRIDKELHWMHNVSTELFTYLFAHPKRGLDAINSDKGILMDFINWLVHDCWSSYFKLDKAKHALCGAHIIRELQGIIDSNNSPSATKMQQFLLDLKKTDFKERLANKESIIAEFIAICLEWNNEEPLPEKTQGKRGKPKKTKARNLLERMSNTMAMVLAFAFNKDVPFTNNLAERDLRPIKLKQKISNCFRSTEGAEIYARIESFISTCRKNGKNIYSEILNTFCGDNFLTVPT
jgi:transposase